MEITHTARVEAGESGLLTAAQVREFVSALPDEAQINAIMRDKGSQRDPEPYLFGLTARWESS